MIVENGTIKNGVVFLFVPGSTAALTTIEYEPGLIEQSSSIPWANRRLPYPSLSDGKYLQLIQTAVQMITL